MVEMIRGQSQIEIRLIVTIEGFSDYDPKTGASGPEHLQFSFPVPKDWEIVEHSYVDQSSLVIPARDCRMLPDIRIWMK
jgi:hypothetical protein